MTDYINLIDNDNNLVLNEDLIRCIGIDASILMIKILGWQRFNERAEKQSYNRHGVYWMPVKGKDLQGDGMGNINYIKQAERKIVKLIELGIVSEHKEPAKKSGSWHRFARVNVDAFNEFIQRWYDADKPNSTSSRKADKEAYTKFMSAWKLIKADFVITYNNDDVEQQDKTPKPTTPRKRDPIKDWVAQKIFKLDPLKVPKSMGFMIGNWRNEVMEVHRLYKTECTVDLLDAFLSDWQTNKSYDMPKSKGKVSAHYGAWYKRKFEVKERQEIAKELDKAELTSTINIEPITPATDDPIHVLLDDSLETQRERAKRFREQANASG
jgi:hypothetical protein